MFWVWRWYGLLWTLHCPKDRYCDVKMIWPLLFRGIRADASEIPDNALTTRMRSNYRLSIDRFFVRLNAICYIFLRNNLMYIEGHNCRLSTVPGSLKKMLGPSALGHLIELVACLATSCARGIAILWLIIGFLISKLRYCCVSYIFVLDKRNTAWLRDTVRQTSLGKSAAGPGRPLTSLGTFAWPYRVTTQYSYFIHAIISG